MSTAVMDFIDLIIEKRRTKLQQTLAGRRYISARVMRDFDELVEELREEIEELEQLKGVAFLSQPMAMTPGSYRCH